jgi:hypothetical protein
MPLQFNYQLVGLTLLPPAFHNLNYLHNKTAKQTAGSWARWDECDRVKMNGSWL